MFEPFDEDEYARELFELFVADEDYFDDELVDYESAVREEFFRLIREEWDADYAAELAKAAERGDWWRWSDIAASRKELHTQAFSKRPDGIDDVIWEEAVIRAYVFGGDSNEHVRRAVIELCEGEPSDVVGPELTGDVAVVWRGGEETIEEAPYRISWTTDPNTALFFMFMYKHKHAQRLYRAKIRTSEVFRYVQYRNEDEVFQYGKVYDVQCVFNMSSFMRNLREIRERKGWTFEDVARDVMHHEGEWVKPFAAVYEGIETEGDVPELEDMMVLCAGLGLAPSVLGSDRFDIDDYMTWDDEKINAERVRIFSQVDDGQSLMEVDLDD